jgi:uncharacterized protein (TIGR00369 family)
VKVDFAEQPAFRNHFGNIQGGFAVAMIDVLVTLAGFVRLRAWLPTVEIKTSFLEPIPIGPCRGDARVLRAGKNLVFVEARLYTADDRPAIVASATVWVPAKP